MTRDDAKTMLDAMTKRQRDAVRDYAQRKADGRCIPSDVLGRVIEAVNTTRVTALWLKPVKGQALQDTIDAVCAALKPQERETI